MKYPYHGQHQKALSNSDCSHRLDCANLCIHSPLPFKFEIWICKCAFCWFRLLFRLKFWTRHCRENQHGLYATEMLEDGLFPLIDVDRAVAKLIPWFSCHSRGMAYYSGIAMMHICNANIESGLWYLMLRKLLDIHKCGDGLLLQKDMELHSGVQDHILLEVPRQGVMAHWIKATAFSILQCWDVRVWSQSADLQLPFRNSHGRCANVLRRIGLVLLSILGSWYLVCLADLILTKLSYMCWRISWTSFSRK